MDPENKMIILSAFKITFPVLLGYIPLGIAFGLLLSGAGYHWSYALLMSIFIYAGSVQFISVALLVAGAGLTEFLIITLLINLRHSFYGLSMIARFSDAGKFKPYLIFALTDETYALLITTELPENVPKSKFYFSIAVMNHFYWVAGSILGAVLGSVIDLDLEGMAFVLTALFVVLTIEQYYHSNTLIPFIAAIGAGGISLALFSPENMLLFSILIGTLFLAVYEKIARSKSTSMSTTDTDQKEWP